ncbi:uncharacterized protein EI97DRAFT_463223 [Westerdykella ornata]|uniref:Uncharacterized protein n=1 Tax=Westerdykella ornata TaxID=318751 RepID=A0A6A6JVZ7_WESOR|nr:uncharacterized protein EI97DRAFT_463223 [Westerdykella ornata]KAF2280772.1 hypothetical protein EI97DRAFT_463223 [Westerdykella ornata]
MLVKRAAVGAALGCPALTVLAQGIAPTDGNRNATAPAPTSTDLPCENRCSVQYPALTAIQWIPASQIIYTTTIVVATVSVIYTTLEDTTYPPYTETLYNPVGPDYNLYSLGPNEQGTVILTASVGESEGYTTWATLTYPTPYIDYWKELHWEGVLQTQDKASNFVCATATPSPANAPLNDHPEYPQPKEVFPGKFDPLGTEHVPLWAPVKDEPDARFFRAAFPFQSAFSFCESVPVAVPLPTEYSAPKYETVTTTVYTTSTSPPGIVIIQPTATGWDREPSRRPLPPAAAHLESSANGFGDASTITKTPPRVTSPAAQIERTTTGFGDGPPEGPQAQQSASPNNGGSIGAPGTPNGALQGDQQDWPAPSPVFTYVPTVIDGRTTSVPAYIMPGSSSTATIGQTVAVNGETTVLEIPSAIFTSVPVRIGPAPTSSPAYIISGSITATIGQTVTIGGTTTVLSIPTDSGGNDGRVGRPEETGRQSHSPGMAASCVRTPWRTLIALVFAIILWA